MIPYVYKRIGTPDLLLQTQDIFGDTRGAIATLEALSWVDQGGVLLGPVQGRVGEVHLGLGGCPYGVVILIDEDDVFFGHSAEDKH